MNNQSIAHRVAKRRRVNYSSTAQNQLSPRKSILIFDDSWLEALKHLTSPYTYPCLLFMSKSLEWLVRNVRSDSIHIPKWISHRIHQTVDQRAKLTNFIFDTSQKCEAQELVFNNCPQYHIEFLNVLIEDFLALPVVQGTIPTVVLGPYRKQEEYRAHLGENLIGREVDSQGADALHVVENGKKRVRISFFCHKGDYDNAYWYQKVYLKFYTI
ncbi:hypothetical protein Ddc_19800 [Ditylenchus destructor]|nr:hypothetical protein Ddc_19800 [Ditylenchus destructor]